ncbi:hypothetical protein BJY04DRAFT_181904 [Aspergillus karnatakaensis]|uniref:DUF3176 domain-containing protein n=1 Tax=Aspergillus karnatakaensis TaxID=1810916 RepID=UPI003CCD0355
MQLFDDASRGPLGSILILFRRKTWSLVSLGAAITLLALAFDPFMQQLLSYTLMEAPRVSSLAAVKQCTTYDSENSFNDFGFRKATNAGIWTDDFELQPACESGNCSWPAFKSVGVCSWCEDVTSTSRLAGCILALDTELNATQKSNCSISTEQGYGVSIPLGAYSSEYNPGGFQLDLAKEAVWVGNPQTRMVGEPSVYTGTYDNSLRVVYHASLGLSSKEPVATHPEQGLQLDKVTAMCPLFVHQRIPGFSLQWSSID